MPKFLPNRSAVGARGFSLIELSIVLVILGVLSAMAYGVWANSRQHQKLLRAQMEIKKTVSILRLFALKNDRLPCPSINHSGLGEDEGGRCTSDRSVGILPYATLGLDRPTDGSVIRYGVFRTNEVDLTEPSTEDGAETELGEGNADAAAKSQLADGFARSLRHKLSRIQVIDPISSIAHIGMKGPTGECDTRIENPAFVVAYQEKRSAGGSVLSMPNCFSTERQTEGGDLLIGYDSSTALLGWLTQHQNQ